MGVPLNHPFIDQIFHEINHPAFGVPPCIEPPTKFWGNYRYNYRSQLGGAQTVNKNFEFDLDHVATPTQEHTHVAYYIYNNIYIWYTIWLFNIAMENHHF